MVPCSRSSVSHIHSQFSFFSSSALGSAFSCSGSVGTIVPTCWGPGAPPPYRCQYGWGPHTCPTPILIYKYVICSSVAVKHLFAWVTDDTMQHRNRRAEQIVFQNRPRRPHMSTEDHRFSQNQDFQCLNSWCVTSRNPEDPIRVSCASSSGWLVAFDLVSPTALSEHFQIKRPGNVLLI